MGVFVVSVDGPDFSGKTTISNLLVEKLRRVYKHRQVKKTELPSHYLTGAFTNILRSSNGNVSSEVYALVYAADHLHHYREYVEKMNNHKQKFLVVQERSLLTSLIYQGLIGKVDQAWLREINKHDKNIPNLNIIIKVPVEEIMKRRSGELRNADAFETEEHLRKQMHMYYNLPKKLAEEFNVVYVDGSGEPEEVAIRCTQLIEKKLKA